jgi:aspartyl-tRNA(Asn)/glutamyl-tRNA(Gln) amidotransferase subunit A
MPSNDLAFLSLTEIARAIARRKVSSREATAACLDRIGRLGAKLNCIAGIDGDAALAAARKADRELAKGNRRGPLHGVPLAHKDMFSRKGRVAACGSRILKDFVPDTTATALERLDAAGALDIGRLNMVEFALGVTGHNDITGPVRNPWNTAYVTGGSSSGSGSAVAARLVYGALGSDTGGSIRFPASCCGLVGLKPTYGRVSRAGALVLSSSLDTVGPLVRTVADSALMLGALAGFDPRDPTTSRLPVPDYRKGLEAGVKGLRIGVPENYFYDPVQPAIANRVRASLEVFRKAGARLVRLKVPEMAYQNPITTLIIAAEGAAIHERWLLQRPNDYGRQTLGRLAAGLMVPAHRYIEALALRRHAVREFCDTVFGEVDALHAPMMTVPVPTIAESDVAANPGFSNFIVTMGHCVRPINFMGLPAISMPCGFDANGLPVAFQLIGQPFDEAVLLRAARTYERETECTAKAPEL